MDFSIDWNFVFLNDRYHACGHYSVGNSLRLLVTGGYDGNQVISFPCLFFYMSVFLLHIFLKIRIRIRTCDKEINCDHHIIICTSWDFWLFTGNTWACTQFNLIINTTPQSFFLVFFFFIKNQNITLFRCWIPQSGWTTQQMSRIGGDNNWSRWEQKF